MMHKTFSLFLFKLLIILLIISFVTNVFQNISCENSSINEPIQEVNTIIKVLYNPNIDLFTIYYSDKSYEEMSSSDFLNLLIKNPNLIDPISRKEIIKALEPKDIQIPSFWLMDLFTLAIYYLFK